MSNKIFVANCASVISPSVYGLKQFTFSLQRFSNAFSDGDGSATNPYIISTKADLQQLATAVNDGDSYFGKYFKLGDNIELTADDQFHIGTSTRRFKGTFDGGGKKITVNYNSTTEYCALFNYVEGATIKNLTVDGTITTSAKFAASIAAHTYGETTINNCHSSVTINSSVNGDGTHGGFVALSEGYELTISNCLFDGKLLGSSTNSCGGFVGWKSSENLTIINCLFVPTEVTISANNSATFARNGISSIIDSYYPQNFGTAQGEKIFALTLPDNVTAAYTGDDSYQITVGDAIYYKNGATFTLTVNGDAPEAMTIRDAIYDEETGTYAYTINNTADIEWWPTTNWSDFTAESLPEAVDGVITITTAEQLAKFAKLVNSGTNSENMIIKLDSDIDLSGKFWTCIGKGWDSTENKGYYFKGTFDGNGHTISGLTINATTAHQGLFGDVEGGTIKNVNLTGVNVTSTNQNVGGLAGTVSGNGSIENCTLSGKVEHIGSSRSMHIGGLIGGIWSGTIKNNLVFNATVNGKNNDDYFIGAVIGYKYDYALASNNLYYNITDDRKGVGKFVSQDSTDNGTAYACKLTLPEGVKIIDSGINVGNDWYVSKGASIILSASTDDKGLKSITIDGETLTSTTGIIFYTVKNNAIGTDVELDDPPVTKFTAENDTTITLVSGLAETIHVAADVTNFSVNGNMDSKDKIIFDKAITSLENIDGGLVANYEDGGAVSIGGLEAQTVGKWRGSAYYFDTLAGAIVGMENDKFVVTWSDAKNASNAEFYITYSQTENEASLKANVTIDTANNVVSLTPAVLREKNPNNSYINSAKYQIVIVEDTGRTNTKVFEGGYNSKGTITNHAANMFIERRDDIYCDADIITNTGDDVTINGGGMSDTINNSGNRVSIFGGTGGGYYPGNEVINNSGSDVTIEAGAGKDTVTNSGTNVIIDGGADNDLIINNAESGVSIITGNGSDVISIGADVKSFTVTDEFSTNDKIVFENGSISNLTMTENNVVIATIGNQVVSIEGFPHGESGEANWNRDLETNIATYAKVAYSATLSSDKSAIVAHATGRGKPLMELGGIVNTDEFTTDTEKKIVSMPFNNNVISGDGASILSNAGGYTVSLTSDFNAIKFYGSELGDTIVNDNNSAREIYGGAGNDSLVNKGNGSQNTLQGGAGNDTLVHNSNWNATLEGNEGDDLVVIEKSESSAPRVYTGTGNDTVSIGAAAQTVVIEDLDLNDKIIFEKKVKNLTYGNLGYNNLDGLTATYEDDTQVKIAGVYLPQEGEWINEISFASYYDNTPAGAQQSVETIDGVEKSVITVTEAKQGTKQFSIYNAGNFYGIKSNATVDNANKTVTFAPSAIRNADGNTRTQIQSNAAGYRFIINADEGRETVKKLEGSYGGDTITNHAKNMIIDSGNGADSLINDADNVTLLAGEGNDVIELTGGANISVVTGNGNDTVKIDKTVTDVTIEDFSSVDAIQFAESVSVENFAEGKGVIATFDDGKKVSISGVELASYDEEAWSVKDGVRSYGRTQLSGNQLSDDGKSISYSENKLAGTAKVAISGLANDPTFEDKTIRITAGNVADNVKVESNAGEFGFKLSGNFNKKTFTGTENADSIENGGINISIDGGSGADYIDNWGNYASINSGNGNDTIINTASYSEIYSGAGDDSIDNKAANVTIDGGDDDNYIFNSGNKVSIVVGEGSDTVYNSGSKVTIELGGSDDSIYNTGEDATISGGAGNDIITNNSSRVSIDSGNGANVINLDGGDNTTVKVADGDDLINLDVNVTSLNVEGFGVGDSIKVAEAAPLEKIDGGIKVGNLTINGISSVATINNKWSGLTYQEETLAGAKLNDTTIVYDSISSGKDLFAIDGLKDTVGVSVDGAQVILTDAALTNRTDNNNVITLTNKLDDEEYKFILANDSTVKTSKKPVTAATLTANGEDYIYSSTAYGEWYNVSGTTITYNAAIDPKDYTISGLSSAASLGDNLLVEESDEKFIFTFKAAALARKSVEITGGDNIEISLASDVATDNGASHSEQISIDNGTLTYEAIIPNAYYAVNGAQVIYTPDNTKESFTLSGLKKNLTAVDNKVAGVTISDDKVTVDENALDMEATEIYTVKLESDDKFKLEFKGKTDGEIPETLENGVYKSSHNEAYFTGSGNEYTFKVATSPTTFKINGLGNGAKLNENVTVANNVVSISSSALSENHATISLENAPTGYSVLLTDSLAETIDYEAEEIGDGVYSVTLGGTTKEGYKFVDGAYVWQEKIGGEMLTVEGLASGKTLTADLFTRDANGGVVFKPTQEFLPDNPATIKISNGVINTSLLMNSETVNNAWNGTAYVSTKTTSTWTSGASSVTYTTTDETNELFRLEGVKTVNDNMIKGNTVTVDKANLADNAKVVKLMGNDYTLALTGVTTSKPATTTTAKFGSVSNGKATYTKTNTTAEYWKKAADSKSYSFVAQAVKTTDLFTLEGIKTTKGISIDMSKKIVTLTAANLNNKNVTFSANTGGYKMALNSDVDINKENISKWTTLSSGNVAYLKNGTGSYYSLGKDSLSVSYTASVAGANQIEFSGVKGTPSLSGSTVKLSASNFNSNVKMVSNAGGYTLALSGNFKNKIFTGTANNDTINSSGSNLVISGGKGNDTVTVGTNNTFLYAKGDGKDVLYNFGSDDKIKLSGTTKATPSVSGKNVTITTDGGKITVKNAAQGNIVKIVNDKDSVISAYTYFADRIVDGKSVTLTSAFKGKFDAKNFTKVDGSGVTNAITIIGGKSKDTFLAALVTTLYRAAQTMINYSAALATTA